MLSYDLIGSDKWSHGLPMVTFFGCMFRSPALQNLITLPAIIVLQVFLTLLMVVEVFKYVGNTYWPCECVQIMADVDSICSNDSVVYC